MIADEPIYSITSKITTTIHTCWPCFRWLYAENPFHPGHRNRDRLEYSSTTLGERFAGAGCKLSQGHDRQDESLRAPGWVPTIGKTEDRSHQQSNRGIRVISVGSSATRRNLAKSSSPWDSPNISRIRPGRCLPCSRRPEIGPKRLSRNSNNNKGSSNNHFIRRLIVTDLPEK